MSPELIKKWDELDSRMEKMIELVGSYPDDVRRAPVGKSFSPADALEHMALTELLYDGLIKNFDPLKHGSKKAKRNFFFKFIERGMKRPAGTTAPTIPDLTPTGVGIATEMSAKKWRDARAKLREHLVGFDDHQTALFHPLFRAMSPEIVFDLLWTHQDYHDARLP
jgi:hypothetical protein